MIVFVTDTRATIMNSHWVESEMDKGGFYTSIRNEFTDSIKDGLTGNLGQAEVQKAYEAIDMAVTDEWVKDNLEHNMDIIYAYLKSQSDILGLSLTLSHSLKDSIKDSVTVIFTANPPEGLIPDQVTAGIDAVNQQVDNLPDKIALQVQNMQELQPARDVIKIYNYAFYIMIALAFFLAVLLIFFHFTVKDAVRIVGVCSLIGGAISWVGVLVLSSMATSIVDEWELPDYITEDMMVKVVRDFTAPANIFSIVLMVLAVLLIVASFLIKRKDEASRLQPIGIDSKDKFSNNLL